MKIATAISILAACITMAGAMYECVLAMRVPVLHSMAYQTLYWLCLASVIGAVSLVVNSKARLALAFLMMSMGVIVSQIMTHLLRA